MASRAAALSVLLAVSLTLVGGSLTPFHGAIFDAGAEPPQPGASGINDTCHRCHVGTSGTTKGGSLTIDGVPERFVPTREYTIWITIERGTGPQPYFDFLYGFQLSADRGEFKVSDVGTSLVSPTEVGSNGAVSSTEWSVAWVAPETDDDVDFYAEAVVADGDGSEEGDMYLRAWAVSYGPLRVPPEDEPRPWDLTYLVVTVVVVGVLALGYALVFTNLRSPPKERG